MSQTAPSFVGKRIQSTRSKEDIVITISQQVERWQETLLMIWLAAWTFCGGVFIFFFFNSQNTGEKVFIGISFSLWAFFFVRLVKVWLWRKKGREIIRISQGVVTIINAYGKKGRPQNFQMQNIFKLGLIKQSDTNFFAFLDNSFWIIGGDKVGFSYSGTKIRMGKQLKVNEAEALVRLIESGIREFSKMKKEK